MFEYEINGKKYEQKALVWGQVQQLISLLKGIRVYQETTATELISIIGDKMPMLLAIVLTEEGKSPKDKKLEEISEEMAFSISVELTIKVVEDFFACNPTALFSERILKLFGEIKSQAEKKISSEEQSLS